MENEKKRYYCEFFKTRLSIKTQEELDRLKLREFVSAYAQEIKHCYSEKYDKASTDGFINMILLDAVFIIELFLRNTEPDKYSRQDYLFATPHLRDGLQRDLLLLENQLPFFILNRLFDKLVVQMHDDPNFLRLAHWYFGEIDPSISSLDQSVMPRSLSEQKDLKHFTHLIRCYYIPLDFTKQSGRTQVDQICATKVTKASNFYNGPANDRILKSATKLNDAGVAFRQLSGEFLLDISFEKNNLLDSCPWLSCLPYVECVKARFQIPQLQ